MNLLHKNITDIILKSYYKVYNNLGYGFLEKVYENALLYELRNHGLNCEKQKPIKVYYEQIQVGEYYADIIALVKNLKPIEWTEIENSLSAAKNTETNVDAPAH